MNSTDLSKGVKGRTVRFSWSDGPTEGTTHVHVFHDDGTVEWHDAAKQGSQKSGKASAERPRYLDEGVGSGMRLVSYLSSSGFTLTVTLNAQNGRIAGVASNEATWTPIHGSFEVVG
jgi:hypothetical protein